MLVSLSITSLKTLWLLKYLPCQNIKRVGFIFHQNLGLEHKIIEIHCRFECRIVRHFNWIDGSIPEKRICTLTFVGFFFLFLSDKCLAFVFCCCRCYTARRNGIRRSWECDIGFIRSVEFNAQQCRYRLIKII